MLRSRACTPRASRRHADKEALGAGHTTPIGSIRGGKRPSFTGSDCTCRESLKLVPPMDPDQVARSRSRGV